MHWSLLFDYLTFDAIMKLQKYECNSRSVKGLAEGKWQLQLDDETRGMPFIHNLFKSFFNTQFRIWNPFWKHESLLSQSTVQFNKYYTSLLCLRHFSKVFLNQISCYGVRLKAFLLVFKWLNIWFDCVAQLLRNWTIKKHINF